MSRTHEYEANLSWSGSTAPGYEAYDRTHTATAPPAAVNLRLSSDPAFRGDPSLLNPEQLLVLSAASCQMLSFLAVASRARIDVTGYEDTARALMPEADRPVRITRIDLHPVITVRGAIDPEKLAHLVRVAHHECFIANSLNGDIRVTPEFHISDD